MSASLPLIQASLFGEAIDRGPVGVLVADENMRYVAVNEFVATLLGYTREELLELDVARVAATPEAPVLYEQFLSEGTQRGTIALRRKDGTEIEVSYHARETRIAGMPLYVSVVIPL